MVACTEANNATDYRKSEADMSLAIVIGSEGQGMSRLVSGTRFLDHIPKMGRHVNPMLLVAASLMMYEVFRKRHDVGEYNERTLLNH